MSNSSRIAKNTLALYFRQILIMLVSLYTVRVVLNTLGAEDYGIYNVVAGVVVLFSFVNNAMATSVQRFLNFYLGKNDAEKTRNVYSASLVIHCCICLIFVVLAETAGFWFVNAKLNIPSGRSDAAFWCYQAAVITTLANIMRVPYNAVIIAYEKMSFFAGLSVVEAVLKLAVVFLLKIAQFDKLIFYSFLLAAVSFIILAIYKFYCNKNFEIAHYRKNQDKGLGKELVSFSGWSLFGAVASVANSQGTNIVLNIFTNVTVNAAMGIANQVNAAVYSFVSNFQTAFNPQLVKSYAAGEKEEFQRLVNRSAKFSFYLLWLIVLPVYVNCSFLLSLWLKNVPQYSIGFVRLVLIFSLIEALNGPLWISIQAAGKIRAYQIIVGIINILNLPFSIAAFCLGANPYWILYIRIALNCATFGIRILLSKKYFALRARPFLRDSVLIPVFIAAVSASLTLLFGKMISKTVLHFFATCIVSAIVSGILIFFIGMKTNERKAIIEKIRRGRK
ncbi:MAG TPA: hypothetical protein DCW73_02540 [Treponema sp.]|uniref:lipopolysaccharide biosynthesis protein n=1 Tax=Treponema sp. UBA7567 TaxID=1947748 RepID=UPI000E8A8852|nr:lipopolysaccharide biosynthesis protein [Treponema sp. UBA7567]HAZ96127.1 hypothetical protein [Treponema sp.]